MGRPNFSSILVNFPFLAIIDVSYSYPSSPPTEIKIEKHAGVTCFKTLSNNWSEWHIKKESKSRLCLSSGIILWIFGTIETAIAWFTILLGGPIPT